MGKKLVLFYPGSFRTGHLLIVLEVIWRTLTKHRALTGFFTPAIKYD